MRFDVAEHKEDDVGQIPDAKAAERDQFANGDARLAQTEPVDCEDSQKYRVEQDGHEVFVRVPCGKRGVL